MHTTSTTLVSSSLTLLMATTIATAEDPVGWSLTEIQGSIETSCFATYHDLETDENDTDWMSGGRGAFALSQLPLASEALADADEAHSEARGRMDAGTGADFLWLDCSSDALAIGPTTGVYIANADAWASADLVATIHLDGPKDVHFRGLLNSVGWDATGEAVIRVERASDGLLIWEWRAVSSDVDIDLKSTLGSGAYRISMSTGGFVAAGDEFLPAASLEQNAWLQMSIKPMTLNPDLNGDQIVDGLDLGVLFADWGVKNSPADLNLDGMVDGSDMGLLFAHWN